MTIDRIAEEVASAIDHYAEDDMFSVEEELERDAAGKVSFHFITQDDKRFKITIEEVE